MLFDMHGILFLYALLLTHQVAQVVAHPANPLYKQQQKVISQCLKCAGQWGQAKMQARLLWPG